jgi:transposase
MLPFAWAPNEPQRAGQLRLRAAVPPGNAIARVDLADTKQTLVVTDHGSRVLARRTFRCRAWELGMALDWAAAQATGARFAGVTVAVEPTGHRSRRGSPECGA